MARFFRHFFKRFLIVLGAILMAIFAAGCSVNPHIQGTIGTSAPQAQTSNNISMSSGAIQATTTQGSSAQISFGKPILGGQVQTSGGYQVTFSFKRSAQ